MIERHGVPLAVYTDGHAVFQPRRNLSDLSPVSQQRSSTQWGRALRELGITQILAHSPEAKGRVERANGTFFLIIRSRPCHGFAPSLSQISRMK